MEKIRFTGLASEGDRSDAQKHVRSERESFEMPGLSDGLRQYVKAHELSPTPRMKACIHVAAQAVAVLCADEGVTWHYDPRKIHILSHEAYRIVSGDGRTDRSTAFPDAVSHDIFVRVGDVSSEMNSRETIEFLCTVFHEMLHIIAVTQFAAKFDASQNAALSLTRWGALSKGSPNRGDPVYGTGLVEATVELEVLDNLPNLIDALARLDPDILSTLSVSEEIGRNGELKRSLSRFRARNVRWSDGQGVLAAYPNHVGLLRDIAENVFIAARYESPGGGVPIQSRQDVIALFWKLHLHGDTRNLAAAVNAAYGSTGFKTLMSMTPETHSALEITARMKLLRQRQQKLHHSGS